MAAKRTRFPDTPDGWMQAAKYAADQNLTSRGHQMKWTIVKDRDQYGGRAYHGTCENCRGGIQVGASRVKAYTPRGGRSLYPRRLTGFPKCRGRAR